MNPEGLVAERIQIVEFALLWAFLGLLIAWRKGFFSPLQSLSQSHELSFFSVMGAFAAYFFCQFILVPAAAGFWLYIHHQSLLNVRESSFSSAEKEWLNLFGMVTGTVVLLLYCSLLGSKRWTWIWRRGDKQGFAQIKSFFLGVSIWFLSYPFVLMISQGIAIVAQYFYHESMPTIEQTAVKYLIGLMENPWLFWMTASSIILVVPIAEELLFRGFLQSWLEEVLGKGKAIFWSSILFASMHFSSEQGMGNIELISALFVLSCFLGYLYARQRSLWAPIGLHVAFNGISVCMILWKELT